MIAAAVRGREADSAWTKC